MARNEQHVPATAGPGETWHIRDFLPEDLEAAVRLDDASTTTAQPPMFALADVIEALTARHPAVVATVGGTVPPTALWARCVASTEDYLNVIASVRPTVTEAMIREFEEDIALTARS